MFEEFLSTNAFSFVVMGILVVFALLLMIFLPRVKIKPRMLAHGALCIAAAFVLSLITLYRMPQGGAVTPASMLPIFLFAYAYGLGPGLLCGFAFSLLSLLGGATIVHPIQLLLDYTLPLTLLALCAITRDLPLKGKAGNLRFSMGIFIAVAIRVALHTLSGVIFFAMYAPEGQSPLVYSLIYNLTATGTDGLICMVVSLIPQVQQLATRLRAQVQNA